jgi:uncharacterized membrane protein YbhN (UPF0104 family)
VKNRPVQRLRALASSWGLRLAVTTGLVAYLLLRVVDLDRLRHSLVAVRFEWLAAAVALYAVGQVLSAVKWALLGRAVGLDGTYAEYVRFYFMGMFFNLLGISTLGGDVARALYLGRGRRPGLALHSVLFDRVSGLAILMALGSVTLLAFPSYALPAALRVVVVTGGIGLVVAWWTCPRLVRLLGASNPLRRRVEIDLAPFWNDRGVLARVAGVSLVFHLSQAGLQWLLGRAANVTLPFTYCLVFHPLMSVMMALPASIGGFGVREAGYVYFLDKIGVPSDPAVAVGLLWWTVTAIGGLLGGLVFFANGATLPPIGVGRDERPAASPSQL